MVMKIEADQCRAALTLTGELPILNEKTDRQRKRRQLLHFRMLGNTFHRSCL
ncbi:hypothetical protein X747_24760 [Mesorhizobium sp. LNJC384A00]|nr:hypothetical protein X747_24760 [Mesorhizobium sp. LNJC384A00]